MRRRCSPSDASVFLVSAVSPMCRSAADGTDADGPATLTPDSAQDKFDVAPAYRITRDDLNSAREMLRVLLEPAGDIVTGQLAPIQTRKIAQIMVEVENLPVLLRKGSNTFLIAASDPVRR